MKCVICNKGARGDLCAKCRRGVEKASHGGIEATAVWILERHRLATPVPDLTRIERLAAAAWVLDRAEQYSNDSVIRPAFDEIMRGLAEGDHMAAWAHGELDDLRDAPFLRGLREPESESALRALPGGDDTRYATRLRRAFLEASEFVNRAPLTLREDMNVRAGAVIGWLLSQIGSLDLAPRVLGCSPEEIVEKLPADQRPAVREMLRPRLSIVKDDDT